MSSSNFNSLKLHESHNVNIENYNTKYDFSEYEIKIIEIFENNNYNYFNDWCQPLGIRILDDLKKIDNSSFEYTMKLENSEKYLSKFYEIKVKVSSKKKGKLICYKMLLEELIIRKDIYRNQKFLAKILNNSLILQNLENNLKSSNKENEFKKSNDSKSKVGVTDFISNSSTVSNKENACISINNKEDKNKDNNNNKDKDKDKDNLVKQNNNNLKGEESNTINIIKPENFLNNFPINSINPLLTNLSEVSNLSNINSKNSLFDPAQIIGGLNYVNSLAFNSLLIPNPLIQFYQNILLNGINNKIAESSLNSINQSNHNVSNNSVVVSDNNLFNDSSISNKTNDSVLSNSCKNDLLSQNLELNKPIINSELEIYNKKSVMSKDGSVNKKNSKIKNSINNNLDLQLNENIIDDNGNNKHMKNDFILEDGEIHVNDNNKFSKSIKEKNYFSISSDEFTFKENNDENDIYFEDCNIGKKRDNSSNNNSMSKDDNLNEIDRKLNQKLKENSLKGIKLDRYCDENIAKCDDKELKRLLKTNPTSYENCLQQLKIFTKLYYLESYHSMEYSLGIIEFCMANNRIDIIKYLFLILKYFYNKETINKKTKQDLFEFFYYYDVKNINVDEITQILERKFKPENFEIELTFLEEFIQSTFICLNLKTSNYIFDYLYCSFTPELKAFTSLDDRDYFYHKVYIYYLEEKDKLENKLDNLMNLNSKNEINCNPYTMNLNELKEFYSFKKELNFTGRRFSKYILEFEYDKNEFVLGMSYNSNRDRKQSNMITVSDVLLIEICDEDEESNKNKTNQSFKTKKINSFNSYSDRKSYSANDKNTFLAIVHLISKSKDRNNSKLTIKINCYFDYEILKKFEHKSKKLTCILTYLNFNLFNFDKSFLALKNFNTMKRCSEEIKNIIFTTDKESLNKLCLFLKPYLYKGNKIEYIDSNELNQSQNQSARTSLNSHVSLITGPPGTGKTRTAVEIVSYWCKIDKNNKILVTCDSNISVDKLYNELIDKNINCIRVGFYQKSKSFYKSMSELNSAGSNEGTIYITVDKITKQFTFHNAKELIKKTRVVCCTLFGSIGECITDNKFNKVIIDEACQANEILSIYPLNNFCDQLVLIGDDKQLPASVFSKRALEKGLGFSLFERLKSIGYNTTLLDEQYRMHPSISKFSSIFFYEGKLKNGPNTQKLSEIKGFSWPNKEMRWVFIDSGRFNSYETVDKTSFYNTQEIDLILTIVQNQIVEKFNFNDLGVITPYDSQKFKLKEAINNKFGNLISFDIDTVDGYQGMEKELIIISLVRANEEGKLGFLTDYRRLNVSLTRASRGLVIIGNVKTLERDQVYQTLIDHAKKHNCLI